MLNKNNAVLSDHVICYCIFLIPYQADYDSNLYCYVVVRRIYLFSFDILHIYAYVHTYLHN